MWWTGRAPAALNSRRPCSWPRPLTSSERYETSTFGMILAGWALTDFESVWYRRRRRLVGSRTSRSQA